VWDAGEMSHEHVFLKNDGKTKIHSDPNIIRYLYKISPDVVITCGFSPTCIYAFAWACLYNKKRISFLDTTVRHEAGLSLVHKAVRRIVFSMSHAFIGCSDQTAHFYASYGIPDSRIFKSHNAISDIFYKFAHNGAPKYDVIFSGQIIERKLPFFFADVCRELKKRINSVRILIMGDGLLRNQLLDKMKLYGLCFDYAGHMPQSRLPEMYSRGKLLLFPTQCDTWGVVAHEALARGIPVITCEAAGVSGELIRHGINGFVLPIEKKVWADHIQRLLLDEKLYDQMKMNAVDASKEITSERSAQGIMDAIQCSIKEMKISK